MDDSRRLRAGLADGGRNVVMIGSGWIGMELAAAASAYGNSVTLLGLEEVPLGAAIGRELGGFFRSLHEANGVRFRLPASAAGIKAQSGRVTGVVTDAGEVLPADLVIIAVGVVPEVSLAEAAGIALQNGILTDASLRTSVPGIFAAGDVANALHPFTGEHHRSEHWSNALNGGKVAAKAMLGQDAVLDTVPYFYTDQFDVSMEYSGFPALVSGPPTIRGSLEGKEFLAFWQRDGRVVAGMSVNWPRSGQAAEADQATHLGKNRREPGCPGGSGRSARQAPAGGLALPGRLAGDGSGGLDAGLVAGHAGLARAGVGAGQGRQQRVDVGRRWRNAPG